MKIKNISVQKIFDSRGEPTIEMELQNGSGRGFQAQIPSGRSRGVNEATVLSYGDAKKVIGRTVKKILRGKNFESIRKFDELLLKIDGSPAKNKLGGNVALGLSIAIARGIAAERGMETWRLLQEEFFKNKKPGRLPLIFSNVINGGAHANNNLDIQEYMVVVKTTKPLTNSIEKLIAFYRRLGMLLKRKRRLQNLPVGDEEGYSVDFKNNFEPITILGSLIKKMSLEKEFGIGLDAAASGLYGKGGYRFGGRNLSRDELLKTYQGYFSGSSLLFSIEDPFAEKDFSGFKELKKIMPKKLVVGDDITTTNAKTIDDAGRRRLIDAVIIKPNQIGTVTETCVAIKTAEKNNLQYIISHRSGETADNFIIDLARASGAYGVKIGAPAKERMIKFNELLKDYGRR